VHGLMKLYFARCASCLLRFHSRTDVLCVSAARALLTRYVTSLIVVLMVLLVPGSAYAQPKLNSQQAQQQWALGFDLFHMLFKQKGLTELRDFDEVMASNPRETVVVVVGNRNLGWSTTEVRRFLDQGGALMMASDSTNHALLLWRIQKAPVLVEEQDAYQGYVDCPQVTDIDPDHPLTKGVKTIVANRTGWIARRTFGSLTWDGAVHLPLDTVPSAASRGQIIASAKVKRSRTGRLIVAADHSIFSNFMLWHGDNALLAINACEWLCETGRSKFLFVSDVAPTANPDLAQNDADKPQVEPPPFDWEDLPNLPPETLLKFGNNVAAGLEDSNILNDLVSNQPRNMSDALFQRSMLLLLALLILVWLIRRLFTPTPVTGTLRGDREMHNMTDLRIAKNIEQNRYHESARYLSREFFTNLTGSPEPADWILGTDYVDVHAGWYADWKIRNELRQLKRMATSDRSWISRSDFRRTIKTLKKLRRLAEQSQLVYRPYSAV